MDLQTLLQAFKLMGSNVSGIFKLIGYQLLMGFIIFLTALAGVWFWPVLFLLIPLIVFSAIYTVQSYRLLFVEDESTTLSKVFEVTFASFKANGWRLFGFNLLMWLLICGGLLFFFGISMSSFDTNSMVIMDMDYAHHFDLTGLVGPILLVLVGIPLFIALSFYINYVDTFISLGQPKATKQAFGQWKSILLCTGISILLSFIPILGSIASMVFSFVLPLKIVLDAKQMMTVSEDLPYAKTGCQN